MQGTSNGSAGVSGLSHADTDYGVYGINDSSSGGGAGVSGSSLLPNNTLGPGTGVQGFAGSGVGVRGSSSIGHGVIASSGTYIALLAQSGNPTGATIYSKNTANGWGIIGESYRPDQVDLGTGIGVEGNSGSGAGVVGTSQTGVGGQFAGGAAAINLVPSPAKTHPKSGNTGDLFLDSANPPQLWLCTVGSTNIATWKKVVLA